MLLLGLVPLDGVPNRSTPSLAAEMRADPSMDGSKRVGRFEALMDAAAPSPRPWETELDERAGVVCMAARTGLLC